MHIELVREVPEAEKPRKINISKPLKPRKIGLGSSAGVGFLPRSGICMQMRGQVMASLRSKFYSRMLRRTFRGRGFGEGLEALKRVRAGEDRPFILSLLSKSAPPYATTEINGNYAEWLGNPQAEYTLLYLHGGGYIMGGPTRTARWCGLWRIMPMFARCCWIIGWHRKTCFRSH